MHFGKQLTDFGLNWRILQRRILFDFRLGVVSVLGFFFFLKTIVVAVVGFFARTKVELQFPALPIVQLQFPVSSVVVDRRTLNFQGWISLSIFEIRFPGSSLVIDFRTLISRVKPRCRSSKFDFKSRTSLSIFKIRFSASNLVVDLRNSI